MANVDSKLHTDGDPLDRSSEQPKRGLKGAAGGIYIGSRTSPNRTTDYVDGAGPATGDAGIDGSRTVEGQSGVPGDHRSVANEAGRALGQDGRGTADSSRDIPQPATQATANPAAAGTVGIIGAAGAIQGDLHADDVTNFAGAEFVVYEEDTTDADADAAFIGKEDFDSATAADIFTGLTAGDFAVYVRFIGTDGAVGPFSARRVITVT